MRRFIFMLLVTLDSAITAINYRVRGTYAFSDRWDRFLERANETLWPTYDGERWSNYTGCKVLLPSRNLGCAGLKLRGFYVDASWDREIGAPPRLFFNAWGSRFYVTHRGVRKVR